MLASRIHRHHRSRLGQTIEFPLDGHRDGYRDGWWWGFMAGASLVIFVAALGFYLGMSA